MKTTYMLAATMAVCLMGAAPVMAGYVATTGPDTVQNTDADASGTATVGDSFFVPAGTFSAYVPTGANDPQINGDLASFGYTLSGNVTSVSGGVVDYSGNYRIFYDINGNNIYDAGTDTSVSFGDAVLTATFVGDTATVLGSLTQTAGPSGPFAGNFADFGARYNNNPATLAGTYVGAGATGTIGGTITQLAPAVVPLPSAAGMGLAVLGLIGAAGMLRKKLQTA